MGNRDWQRHTRKRKRDLEQQKSYKLTRLEGRKDKGIDKDLKGLK